MVKISVYRLLLVLTLVLVLFFGLTWFALNWSSKVGNIVVNRLKEAYNVEMDYKAFKLHFWAHFPNISLQVDQVHLYFKDSIKGADTLFSSDQLYLVFHTSKLLLDNKIELSKLGLVKPHFYYKVDLNGNSSFDVFTSKDTLSKEHTDSSEVRFAIRSLEIEGGKIFYTDMKQHALATLVGIHGSGELQLNADSLVMYTDLDLRQSSLLLQNKKIWNKIAIGIKGQYTLLQKSNQHKCNNLLIRINQSECKVNGAVSMRGNDSVWLDTEMQLSILDLADFNPWIAYIMRVDGTYFGRGSLNGKVQSKGWLIKNANIWPKTQVEGVIDQVNFQIPNQKANIINIGANFSAHSENKSIENWRVKVDGISMQYGNSIAKGYIHFISGKTHFVQSKWNFKAKLEDFASYIHTDTLQVWGDVEGKWTCKGKLNVDKQVFPEFDSELKLSNGTLKHVLLRDSVTHIHSIIKCKNQSNSLYNTTLTTDSLYCWLGKDAIYSSFGIVLKQNPYVKCRVETRMSLKELQHLASIKGLEMQGMADMRLKAEGTLDIKQKKIPPYSFVVKIKDAEINNPDNNTKLRELQMHADVLNLSGNINDTKVSIYNLKFKNDENSFSAFGIINNLESPSIDCKVKGSLDLDYINKLSGGSLADFKGVMQADVLLKLKWQDILDEKFEKVSINGQISSKDLRYMPKAGNYSYHIRDMQVRLQPDKIVIENAEGVQSDGKFKIKGNVINYWHYITGGARPKADLMLTLDDFSIKRYLVAPSSTQNKPTPFDFSVLNLQEINVQLFAQKLTYDTISFAKFIGTIVVKPEKFIRLDVKFDAFSGQFYLTSTLHFPNTKKPNLALKVDARNMDIYSVLKSINYINGEKEEPSIFGRVNMSYKVQAPLNLYLEVNPTSVTGQGSFALNTLRMKGHKVMKRMSKLTHRHQFDDGELENIEIYTDVHHGRLYFQPFTLKLSGFATDIEGYYQFTDGNMYYVLKVIFPPFNLVKIPIVVSGNKSDPKVTYGSGDDAIKKYIDSLVVQSKQ